MTGPRVVVLDDGCGVVVPPGLVRPVLASLGRDANRAYRDDGGVTLSDAARALMQALHDADVANSTPATSAVGTESWVFPDGGSQWVTCDQASKVLGCSPRWVRDLARRGELGMAVRQAGVWLIPAASVRLYRARRRRVA